MKLLRHWFDQLSRLSIYLPVALMGLLVLASYWLLRITPPATPPEPERPVSEKPDFFMRGFSVKSFDEQGRLKSEVRGTEARHHPHNDTLVIDNARIRAVSEQGLTSTARSDLLTSNAEGTDMLLEGQAEVVRQAGRSADGKLTPRMEFHGPVLRVRTDPERVTSDQPVLLIRGNDQITGDNLDYLGGEDRVADIDGRVNATLAPRP
ncbi:MAG: LPS export ABC transporter periplasmic protein LptC [Gammaproteobacteria bacterium]